MANVRCVADPIQLSMLNNCKASSLLAYSAFIARSRPVDAGLRAARRYPDEGAVPMACDFLLNPLQCLTLVSLLSEQARDLESCCLRITSQVKNINDRLPR